MKVVPLHAVSDERSDGSYCIHCLRYSASGTYLAAACSDGFVRVYTQKGDSVHKIRCGSHTTPVTSLSWKPDTGGASTGRGATLRNVLICTLASGHVMQVHVPSSKVTWKSAPGSEDGDADQLLACAYAPREDRFAVGGRKRAIFVFDGSTRQILSKMDRGSWADSYTSHTAHSNRIVTLQFHPTSPHLLYSAAIDSSVQQWDLRCERSTSVLSEVEPLKDSIFAESSGRYLLTASYRDNNQMQIWDVRKPFQFVSEVPMDGSSRASPPGGFRPSRLHAIRWNEKCNIISCAGSRTNQFRVLGGPTEGAAREGWELLHAELLSHAPNTLDIVHTPDSEYKLLLAVGVGASVVVSGASSGRPLVSADWFVRDPEGSAQPDHLLRSALSSIGLSSTTSDVWGAADEGSSDSSEDSDETSDKNPRLAGRRRSSSTGERTAELDQTTTAVSDINSGAVEPRGRRRASIFTMG